MDDAKKKRWAIQTLEKARKILTNQNSGPKEILEGLALIVQVGHAAPECMDPLLLAAVPLFIHACRGVAKRQDSFEHSWESDDDHSGTAA